MHFFKVFLAFIFFASTILTDVSGHGRLEDPPNRSSLWRFTDNPLIAPHADRLLQSQNDDNLDCGGRTALINNDGKCGVCGDPFDGVRENEAGGKYGLGIISKRYVEEQIITATVRMTIGHTGFFEFRLCSWNNPESPVTQECLDRYLLQQENGDTAWDLPSTAAGIYEVRLQLPENLTCTQCVFQWKHTTRDFDPDSDNQEREWYGCADIAIDADPAKYFTTPVITEAATTTTQPLTTVSTSAETTQRPSTTSLRPTTTQETLQLTTTLATTTTQRQTTTKQQNTSSSTLTHSSRPQPRPRPNCMKQELKFKCFDCTSAYLCLTANFPLIVKCPRGNSCDSRTGFCSFGSSVSECET